MADVAHGVKNARLAVSASCLLFLRQINGNATPSPTENGRQRKPLRRKTKPARGDLRYGRMAVANNNGLLPNTDRRMGFARRYKQIVSTIVDQWRRH